MGQWIDVGSKDELAQDGKRCLSAQGHRLVLCQVDGAFTAIENNCPHAGMPIGEGPLDGHVLTCPFHGYAYNVKTGKNVDYEADVPLTVYNVMVENDRVMVEVDGD